MFISITSIPEPRLIPTTWEIAARLRGGVGNLLGRGLRGVARAAGRIGGAISRRAGAAARRLGQ